LHVGLGDHAAVAHENHFLQPIFRFRRTLPPLRSEESIDFTGLKSGFGISSLWLRLLPLQEREDLSLLLVRFGDLIKFDTADFHPLAA
jgi:hypothetical protein